MQKTRLNPDALEVTSFQTAEADKDIGPIVTFPDPNDPTAATWCYICPAETYDICW